MSFADKVKAAIERADSVSADSHYIQYTKVLDEFAEGVRSQGVDAIIRPSADKRRLWFHAGPHYRPNQLSPVISFFIDGEQITAYGEVPSVFSNTADLEEWLLAFIQQSALLETLSIHRRTSTEPVEARLQKSEDQPISRDDVLALVSADDQKRLAETPVGGKLKLAVTRFDFPGNGAFRDPPDYRALDSAGILLRVQDSRLEGRSLVLEGERAR